MPVWYSLCLPFSHACLRTSSSYRTVFLCCGEVTEFCIQFSGLRCVTPEIASLMRVIIILCFMAMSCSLVGFFLDIVGPTKRVMKIVQRNSIPSIFTGKLGG